MLRETAGRSFLSQWDPFIILVFHSAVTFTLIHPCRGQSQVIGSLQPVVALIGDDAVLPCHLDPVMDASGMTVEWARPDLEPRFVLVRRDGEDLKSKKHPLYERRTSMFTDELTSGNISLKISNIKPSDGGTYRCFVPDLKRDAEVQLIVGAASSPVAQINRTISKVELQCESAGWYPEPELLWLDGEGNLLPAGPTESLRGPDGLYTVSSRVTVEKKHSNNFTCRVQQKNINQSRETHIHVPDEFFAVISPAGNPNTIVGAVISAAVVLILVLAVFFVLWKQRRDKCKNKMKDKKIKDKKMKDPECVEEGENEPLMKGREEETAVDVTGERTNMCPVPEEITEFKMKKEEEDEEDLDSRGEQSHKDEGETQQVHFVSETDQIRDICSPQEKSLNPPLIIKQDKFTTEQKSPEEAETGRGEKAEGGEGETKMEAGKEESGLQFSTCAEKPKEQQVLERETFNSSDSQKKPQKNQREEEQREKNQRKLQSETRKEADKDETGLQTPKNTDKRDLMEGKKEDKIETKKELNQDQKQLQFQSETKPETKEVQTELKTQETKNRTAPKNQDKNEGKTGGNKGKGQKENREREKNEEKGKLQGKERESEKNETRKMNKGSSEFTAQQQEKQKREKKLPPVSSDVPERKDLTVQGITPEENKEKEEAETRAEPENLRGAERKKAAEEEVTKIKEGIHTEETCRKNEEKGKLQLDMNEKTVKQQPEEPVSPSEGGVASQEEPQELEVDENLHVDQNSTKGQKYARVRVVHKDQQQTGRKRNHQENHEQQGRTSKRRKEKEEEDDDDDLMEVEGETNNKEDLPAGSQRKRGKFHPEDELILSDHELVCQEDQQENMETQ